MDTDNDTHSYKCRSSVDISHTLDDDDESECEFELENIVVSEKTRIEQLEEEVRMLKEKLKRYTAPERKKKYYESHKQEIKAKVKEHLTPEKKKEYNRAYYLKKKEKENTVA
jgi:hypothetical protein